MPRTDVMDMISMCELDRSRPFEGQQGDWRLSLRPESFSAVFGSVV